MKRDFSSQTYSQVLFIIIIVFSCLHMYIKLFLCIHKIQRLMDAVCHCVVMGQRGAFPKCGELYTFHVSEIKESSQLGHAVIVSVHFSTL